MKFKTRLLICFSLTILAYQVSSQASWASASDEFQCTGTPHTVHVISTNKDATCVLAKLYEPEHFCLTDAAGNRIEGTPFAVSPGQNTTFGMIFDSDADFNMEYALTCTVNNGTDVQSPKVIFTIGANGPADPDVSVIDLYGAQGSWKATGSGENYFLTY